MAAACASKAAEVMQNSKAAEVMQDGKAAEVMQDDGAYREVSAESFQAAEKNPDSVDEADKAFMCAAAASALAGVHLGHGGPFGASIVRDGVIIACAHNMVLHRKDPTGHAEMNAIQQACQAIGSEDLSDCELYTTCEPCPMCWGAVQWARLSKVHIGVDRHTAAKYGFDDKVFYDEVDSKAGWYGIRRTSQVLQADKKGGRRPSVTMVQQSMVEVFDGLLSDEVHPLFTDPKVNKTLRRRMHSDSSDFRIADAYKEVFQPAPRAQPSPLNLLDPQVLQRHEDFMRMAAATAERAAKKGKSKEHEPFGVVIVKDGRVLAECFNSVTSDRDATATAEVNAIRLSAEKLKTHNLEGCEMYCTTHPDLMSLGAVMWARIGKVYCGVSQQIAAQCGFEEGILHFKDLIDNGGRGMTTVIEGVAKAECEAVFKEWSDRNGVIY